MDIKELDIFSRSGERIRHPWEVARMRIIKRLLQPIFENEASDCSILDVGCGDAYVIEQLDKSWPSLKYIGVDSAFTNDFIEKIKKQSSFLGKTSFCSDLSNIQTTDSIRVALLLDVLEHIEDDQALLTDVASRLDKGGHALITVPAFQKLYYRHDKWLGHYRRYSRKDIQGRVEKAGLTPVSSGYFFSGLLVPRILLKTIEMTLIKNPNETPKGIGQWKYGKFLGNIIASLLYCNGCLDIGLSKSGIHPIGLSVFSLCQK